jgi:hypothetical protein
MEAIGRYHQITHAFLQQAWNDLERNGLSHVVRIPGFNKYKRGFTDDELSSIPLITRTPNITQQGRSALLPGRLPLEKPLGAKIRIPSHESFTEERGQQAGTLEKMATLLEGECWQTVLAPIARNIDGSSDARRRVGVAQKRKRMSPSPGPDRYTGQNPSFLQPDPRSAGAMPDLAFSLPDRTGSSSSSSPAYRGTGTDTQQSGSSHTSPSMLGLGNTAEENRIDLRQFQGRVAPPPQWDMSEPFFFGEVTDEMVNEALGQTNGEPWSFLTADIQWPSQGGQGG